MPLPLGSHFEATGWGCRTPAGADGAVTAAEPAGRFTTGGAVPGVAAPVAGTVAGAGVAATVAGVAATVAGVAATVAGPVTGVSGIRPGRVCDVVSAKRAGAANPGGSASVAPASAPGTAGTLRPTRVATTAARKSSANTPSRPRGRRRLERGIGHLAHRHRRLWSRLPATPQLQPEKKSPPRVCGVAHEGRTRCWAGVYGTFELARNNPRRARPWR